MLMLTLMLTLYLMFTGFHWWPPQHNLLHHQKQQPRGAVQGRRQHCSPTFSTQLTACVTTYICHVCLRGLLQTWKCTENEFFTLTSSPNTWCISSCDSFLDALASLFIFTHLVSQHVVHFLLWLIFSISCTDHFHSPSLPTHSIFLLVTHSYSDRALQTNKSCKCIKRQRYNSYSHQFWKLIGTNQTELLKHHNPNHIMLSDPN